MTDNYYIDLEKYPLAQFKNDLKESKLLPSRKILKEHIDKRFKILNKNGIRNLQNLTNTLKTPKKAKEFAEKSGLPYDYLIILRREVNSYTPKPVNLDKFPRIESEVITKLNAIGIKNTAHLFKRVRTEKDRRELSAETDMNYREIIELTKLTDLSRIKWIGPIFARLFFESGTDTSQKVSDANANLLFKQLVEINAEKGYTKGKFIESDVELCIKVAKMVPKVIEY
jgi:hypothetical protein